MTKKHNDLENFHNPPAYLLQPPLVFSQRDSGSLIRSVLILNSTCLFIFGLALGLMPFFASWFVRPSRDSMSDSFQFHMRPAIAVYTNVPSHEELLDLEIVFSLRPKHFPSINN